MRIGDFFPLASPGEACTGETCYKEILESTGLTQVLHIGANEAENGASFLAVDTKELDASQLQELEALVSDFRDTFSTGRQDLGRTNVTYHQIDTGDAAPIKQAPRRQEVEHLINEMQEQGVIQPSQSPWASPIVLVQKKDGSTRFCVDYRKVNKVTRKDSYPLPRVDDILDSLAGAQWFSTLDLASGYWQVEVHPQHREKTAFTTGQGSSDAFWVMQCPKHISASDGAGIGGTKMGYLPGIPGWYCGVWTHFWRASSKATNCPESAKGCQSQAQSQEMPVLPTKCLLPGTCYLSLWSKHRSNQNWKHWEMANTHQRTRIAKLPWIGIILSPLSERIFRNCHSVAPSATERHFHLVRRLWTSI